MPNEKLTHFNCHILIRTELLRSDLPKKSILLYGIIDQMYSHGMPWEITVEKLSRYLGVGIRQTQRLASKLIEKDYIEHFQNENGEWTWKIK